MAKAIAVFLSMVPLTSALQVRATLRGEGPSTVYGASNEFLAALHVLECAVDRMGLLVEPHNSRGQCAGASSLDDSARITIHNGILGAIREWIYGPRLG